MSLAQRLQEAREAALKPKLSPFEEWFEARDDSDKEALLAAVVASELPIRALHDAVTAEGAPIGRDKFTQWLRANGYRR